MEALLVVLVALVGSTTAEPAHLDLSRTYNRGDEASHRVKVLENGENRVYIGVELNQICSFGHYATHIEAPSTFNNDSWNVGDIPLERLWRVPAIRHTVYYDELITAKDLQNWEDRTGLIIPDGGIFLIRVGAVQRSKLSTHDDGEDSLPEQPRLSEDAGAWLANYGSRHGLKKGIYGVGTDLNSLDGDVNSNTSARARLYEQGIYALHGLKELDMLPFTGFSLTVMPMKIQDASAAPTRVLAEKDDTRSKPDDSEEDGRDPSHWRSESDYRYPSSHRRYGPVMTSGARDRSGTGLYSSMVLVLPLVVVLKGYN